MKLKKFPGFVRDGIWRAAGYGDFATMRRRDADRIISRWIAGRPVPDWSHRAICRAIRHAREDQVFA